jgi:hypothetical protein
LSVSSRPPRHNVTPVMTGDGVRIALDCGRDRQLFAVRDAEMDEIDSGVTDGMPVEMSRVTAAAA